MLLGKGRPWFLPAAGGVWVALTVCPICDQEGSDYFVRSFGPSAGWTTLGCANGHRWIAVWWQEGPGPGRIALEVPQPYEHCWVRSAVFVLSPGFGLRRWCARFPGHAGGCIVPRVEMS